MRLENWFITNPDASQQEVLKVPINQNLIVKGAAGSGKTNMAIYRANQAGNNSFVIVVYTVALKKMVRYGLSELGLDKDRVIHEWSWINRGIEISGDLFCFGTKKCHCKTYNEHSACIDRNILILKEDDKNVRVFVYKQAYEEIISTGTYKGLNVRKIDNPLEICVDFDDWVHNRFYYNFYRRSLWYREVQIVNFQLDINAENIVFIPSGFIYKEKGIVNYLIIDEGQDFSISDYQRNFIAQAKQSITIFGDTNQQLYRNRGTNVDEIARYFKYPKKDLEFNYRFPKTIAKIAQTIPLTKLDLLSNNKKNNGNSDFPHFPKPIIKKCNSEDEELQYIINRIETEGLDDVAILIWENNTVEKVHSLLQSKGISSQVRYTIKDNTILSGFRKVDTLDFTNHDLPCLLTFHSAKGTEFDNIFIPFANEDTGMDRNAFYVAVTRSSSRVFITYSRKLTSLLKNINPNDIIYQ
ncbi:MAG: ATP-binding domain-containing protein [Bacteroidota bacterium]|nr:ATP-binding domain-containing protein [Bacteroidota bacterium]